MAFLGMIITPDGVKMDPKKVKSILEWPQPKNVTDVQSFLGLANYYRCFVEGFSGLVHGLHELLKKDQQWFWSENQQFAFEYLKYQFTIVPILVYAKPISHKLKVETDASGFASGGVLSQLEEDGKWHPVAFISKSFSVTKRNYDIHDREMLAIIRALDEWRHYLEGATYVVEIWTDHKNLEYSMTNQKLNRRQARWALFLSRFDFILKHRPGKSMGKPDALSRRSDFDRGESDNMDTTLLKPEFFKVNAMRQTGEVIAEGSEKSILSKIRKSKAYDESVAKAIEELKRSPTNRLHEEEWSLDQELILFNGKVYVPKDMAIRTEIVKLCHDSTIAGHPGRFKTLELISRNYWWPGMSKFVAAYIKGCEMCQRTKTFPSQPAGKLQLDDLPERPWQKTTADFITDLPECQGYDSILIVLYRMIKEAHFIPCNKSIGSLGLAALYRDNVWKLHGLQDSITSDHGPQFAAQLMKDLNSFLNIETKLSTAYHPQTDSQTERTN